MPKKRIKDDRGIEGVLKKCYTAAWPVDDTGLFSSRANLNLPVITRWKQDVREILS
jgi:hypothetical protein